MSGDRDGRIGPVLATGLVAGNIVGSGIFLLPATLAAAGSISVAGWVLSTACAFITTAVFATLGRLSPSPEGMVGYVARTLGGFPAFAVAAVYWMASLVGAVAMAVAVAGYLSVFAPALSDPGRLALAAAGAVWVFTALNLTGARAVARFSTISLAAGVAPLVFIGVFGWLRFDPHVFAASWNVSGRSDFSALRITLISTYWAYTGFETGAVASAVVRDPARNVPIATYCGTALAAVVYVSAATVLTGLAPADLLARSSAPFALAAGRAFGPWAGGLIGGFALIKTCGTLNGWILVVAESARAGADVHLAPGRFAPDPDRPAPAALMLAMAVAMSVMAVASSAPSLGRQFGALVDVSAAWTIAPYCVCCLALWRLAGSQPGPRSAALRGVALVALAFNLWILSTSDRATTLASAGLLAAVVAAWALIVRRRTSVQPGRG